MLKGEALVRWLRQYRPIAGKRGRFAHYPEVRRSVSLIVENLYLGNIFEAKGLQKRNPRNISAVVSLFGDPKFPQHVDCLRICQEDGTSVPDNDDGTANLYNYFDVATRYIHGWLELDRPVFVHCYAGKSRSATIVTAYLMAYRGLAANSALEFVQWQRPIADPNKAFRSQLELYQSIVPPPLVESIHDVL